MMNYKFLYITGSIVIAFFAYIFFLYNEQKNSYVDLYVELCENDCRYFFPKELRPKIISSGSNKKPTINFYHKIYGKNISIWLNLSDYKFNYKIDKKENEKNITIGIIKKSNQFDSNFKKFYFYFYDKDGTKVAFLDNSFVLKVEKKLKNNLLIYYTIPSKFISDIVIIDEKITEKINSLKVIDKND